VDRVKLSEKSFEELNEIRLKIESDPNSKNPDKKSWFIYSKEARKKLDDIAWAVTLKLKENRKKEGDLTDG